MLQECIDYLRQDDVLHVHSIERIARNLKDLQEIIDRLLEKGVSSQFHKEGLTFNGDNDAMSKLMLQMMGAFAEFERSLIHERQRQGIAAASKAGKRFGRKRVLTEAQILEIKKKINCGCAKAVVASEYGVSRTTLYAALV
jgi:DNA invertase Pin-like site-specific DNA recombinase